MKTVWTILVSFILTAVIVGGSTYYFMNTRAVKDKDDLQSQITELNRKVSDTEKNLADAQATTTTQTTTPEVIPVQTNTTTDPTADWKTYASSYYSYSVKYPSTWTVDLTSKDRNGQPVATFLAPGTSNTPRVKMIEIQVAKLGTVSKVGSDDYLRNNNVNPVTSTSKVSVGGMNVDKIVTSLGNGNNTFVYLDKGDYTYSIDLSNASKSDSDYISVFNQMLSTFQFTK